MIDGYLLGVLCLVIGISVWLITVRLFFNDND